MYYVNVGVADKIVKIVILGYRFIKSFFSKIGCRVEVIFINVADSGKTASVVAVKMVWRLADTAYADDAVRQLVAGCGITVAAEDVTGYDGEETGGAECLQESPSTCHDW